MLMTLAPAADSLLRPLSERTSNLAFPTLRQDCQSLRELHATSVQHGTMSAKVDVRQVPEVLPLSRARQMLWNSLGPL